jgi:transposase
MQKDGHYYHLTQTRAFNTATLATSVQELLVSLGRDQIHNAVFFADNVPFHKATEIRGLFAQAGHQLLFLPPYSPFLNPIEQVFAKWKAIVRSKRPMNEQELFEFIEEGQSLITESDCQGFFRHMIGFLRRCMNREQIIDEPN